MKTILALDTEDDSKGTVYCINFFDGNTHHTFYSQADSLAWLCEKRGHIEIWAVNLGYDLNNLFCGYFDRLEIIYAKSRVISARLLGCQVYFRDTLNHWKMSVEEMGKRINLPKIKTRNKKDIIYCQRDTEICWKFVDQMRIHYEKIGCSLKATIGSTALEYFYKIYSRRPSEDEVLKTNEIEFIKKSYKGGRTEIFHTNALTGNIQYFDINSLYPAVMAEFPYPVLDDRSWVREPNFNNEGVLDVTLEVSYLQIPYLSVWSKKGLIFPCGIIKGVFTYFEIREALKLGYKIRNIRRGLEFSQNYRPFVEFVKTLYDYKLRAEESGDMLLALSAKDIMRNLYGKFGQGNEFSKLVPYNPLKDEGIVYGPMVLKKTIGKYPRHANAIWASYTTAYARHILYQGLRHVSDSGGLLIYCDTDSIIFESEKKIIKPSKKMGEFKFEGEFRYAHFKLPKLYCLIPKKGKWIYRSKGVPRKSASIFFRTGYSQFRRPYKLRETLKRNLSPKRIVKLIPNYWELTKKEMRHKYDKRIIQKTGHTRSITLR